ncbi:MAG: ISAs1 family transposase [Coleofasciculus sp. G3-WIS-01]|uniref:ISAs1 family transposase n=1 Tax=Coleofasciculus sp. G3-WIS-01 TaxID=3069528 RepID=UPI0032FE51C6
MLTSIIEGFKKVKDFRHKRGKRHELWVVLSIIFLGLMTGNVNYQQIAKFSSYEKEKLIQWLGIPQENLPSYSTIRRVMIGLNTLEIKAIFEDFVEKHYWLKDGEDWLAVDGKNLKNTLTDYENNCQNILINISAYSPETQLVIKSEAFESQESSENAEVRTMIEKSGLVNKVFTLDALHCSQKTTRTIIESKNDYLITVKKNQIKLYNRLKELSEKEKPLSEYQREDGSHGRKITRTVSVFDGQKLGIKNYPHLHRVISVKRQGWRERKEGNETLYYISSKKLPAQIFAEKIQQHWGIENQVHWVKDVVFQEDNLRIKDCVVAEKFSLLTTLIMNLCRICGFLSISKGQVWLGKHWQKMLLI